MKNKHGTYVVDQKKYKALQLQATIETRFKELEALAKKNGATAPAPAPADDTTSPAPAPAPAPATFTAKAQELRGLVATALKR